jgi:toxin FitB
LPSARPPAVPGLAGRSARRAIDLAIVASANIHGVPLLTHNTGNIVIISDLTDVRALSAIRPEEPDLGNEPPSDA